jgi:hypothetical protein
VAQHGHQRVTASGAAREHDTHAVTGLAIGAARSGGGSTT